MIKVTKRELMVLLFAMDVMRKKVAVNMERKSVKIYKNVMKSIEKNLLLNNEKTDEEIISVSWNEAERKIAKEFVNGYMKLIEKESRGDRPWYEHLNNFNIALILADIEEQQAVV